MIGMHNIAVLIRGKDKTIFRDIQIFQRKSTFFVNFYLFDNKIAYLNYNKTNSVTLKLSFFTKMTNLAKVAFAVGQYRPREKLNFDTPKFCFFKNFD